MNATRRHFISALVSGGHPDLLKRAAVQPILVFKVKRDSRGLSRRERLPFRATRASAGLTSMTGIVPRLRPCSS